MKYECAIWDWNGTLLDDIKLSVDVFNSMLGRWFGTSVTATEYKSKFRFPVEDFYKDYGFDFSKQDFDEVGRHFIKTYNARRFECPLHKGAEDCLRYLSSRGIKQSILSAYERNHLLDAVRHYHIDSYFENICGLENIYAASKVELGKALVAKIGIPPEKILMIGDTDHDKRVADAMGVDCALLATGHNSFERLEKLGCKVFDDHGKLLDFFKSQV
ncbi:putative phosphatase [Coraliomargarita sp. CAG:312]|nr:putative phosphatase [Coraliomargarita sp. CAG:312]